MRAYILMTLHLLLLFAVISCGSSGSDETNMLSESESINTSILYLPDETTKYRNVTIAPMLWDQVSFQYSTIISIESIKESVIANVEVISK